MKHIIVGSNGEVGKCVLDFFKKYEPIGIDINSTKERQKCDYLHICIPYSDKFVDICKEYINLFNPKYIIVYSSVLPGTTRQLGDNAVHSPIEGRHPHLLISFKTFTRFVSGKKSVEISKIFSDNNLNVITYSKPEITELAKLLSTTRYGINLMFAQESQEICNELGLDFNEVVLKYQNDYNKSYACLREERFIQPLLTSPNGKIGGHCVVQNAKLLIKKYNKELILLLSKFNERGKRQ